MAEITKEQYDSLWNALGSRDGLFNWGRRGEEVCQPS